MAQDFCNRLAQTIMGGAALLATMTAFHRCSGAELASIAASIMGIAALIAAAQTWRARLTLTQVASLLDRRAGTCDRLASGLAFEAPSTPMHASALAECENYLGTHFDGCRWTPWSVPKASQWILAPVVLIVLLRFWQGASTGTVASKVPRPPVQIAVRTATELERMASRLEMKPGQNRPAELQKIADALKGSASRLRQEATMGIPASASKATLRELSSLEELLRSTQDGNALDTLGDALAKTDDGKEAAQALKKHDPKAPEKLEELGKKLVEGENKDKPMKQLATAMADAAAKLGENSAMGSAASNAGKAAGSGNATDTGNAMGQLGQAVRELNASGGGEGSGSQQMQGMISKLQEMKNGHDGGKAEDQSSSGDRGGEAKAAAQAVAESSPDRKQNEPQPSGGTSGEQGRPQSKFDPGTKKTPFGSVVPENFSKPGKQVQLAGTLGRGESLRAMVATMPGAESARAAYKPLYDAAQPAAEDALAAEPIPIGSRLFVKRYFEAIRPK